MNPYMKIHEMKEKLYKDIITSVGNMEKIKIIDDFFNQHFHVCGAQISISTVDMAYLKSGVGIDVILNNKDIAAKKNICEMIEKSGFIYDEEVISEHDKNFGVGKRINYYCFVVKLV